jgi:hypothetical protein
MELYVCSIYLWLYSPFVGPWPLFQFLNPIHSRDDFLGGGSARRKAAAFTQNNTKTKETHRDVHALSGIRTQNPSVRAKTVHTLDRAATEIGGAIPPCPHMS